MSKSNIKSEKLEKKKDSQKRSQRIVRSQQYVYVTYMEEHPDFVENESREHWKVLAKRLNEVNGPKKSPEDWKSTFMRWKHQVAYRARQAATGNSPLYRSLTQIDVRALIAMGKEIPMNCHIIGETEPSEVLKMHLKRQAAIKCESSKAEEIEIVQQVDEEEMEEEEEEEHVDKEEEGETVNIYTLEEEEYEVEVPKTIHEPLVKTYQGRKRKAPVAESTRILPHAAPSNIPICSRATSPDSPQLVTQVTQQKPLDDRDFQLKKRKVLALERRAMAQERIADAFERIVNVLESRFERDLTNLI
uniref:Uncharacterized protein n=1 Tax=Phlebotomus papatasi TaxID=29031 RepID=A0A1B0DMQ0_PHLPP